MFFAYLRASLFPEILLHCVLVIHLAQLTLEREKAQRSVAPLLYPHGQTVSCPRNKPVSFDMGVLDAPSTDV